MIKIYKVYGWNDTPAHRYIADTKATVRIVIRSEEDTIRYGTDVTHAKVRNEHKISQITISIFQLNEWIHHKHTASGNSEEAAIVVTTAHHHCAGSCSWGGMQCFWSQVGIPSLCFPGKNDKCIAERIVSCAPYRVSYRIVGWVYRFSPNKVIEPPQTLQQYKS